MGLREVLTGAFAFVGIVTTAYIALSGGVKGVNVISKVKKLTDRCNHIWIAEDSFEGPNHIEYQLKCKKCGKEKHIEIWKRGE